MEQANNYIEDIKADLSILPEEHLATIRDMIRLIAKSYKTEEEENKVSTKLLQDYITEVREGFGLYFEESKKLNASYHIGENLTYACFSVVDIDIFEEESKYLETSMEELLEEKEVSKEVFEQKLEEQKKVSLYEENSFYVVKHTKSELWQKENAQEDAKEEIGKVLSKLPNYSEDEL